MTLLLLPLSIFPFSINSFVVSLPKSLCIGARTIHCCACAAPDTVRPWYWVGGFRFYCHTNKLLITHVWQKWWLTIYHFFNLVILLFKWSLTTLKGPKMLRIVRHEWPDSFSKALTTWSSCLFLWDSCVLGNSRKSGHSSLKSISVPLSSTLRWIFETNCAWVEAALWRKNCYFLKTNLLLNRLS